jgi:hypothetical protein
MHSTSLENLINALNILQQYQYVNLEFFIFLVGLKSRVVDPYSFFPDPDPEFDVGDQYGSGSNTDPGL